MAAGLRDAHDPAAQPEGWFGQVHTAPEIAVAATLACQRVALVDLNPQGITTGWYSRRGAEEPVLLAATPTEPDLAVAEAAGVEVLVIDTPPGAPAYLPALAARADVVLGRPDHRPTTCWRPR